MIQSEVGKKDISILNAGIYTRREEINHEGRSRWSSINITNKSEMKFDFKGTSLLYPFGNRVDDAKNGQNKTGKRRRRGRRKAVGVTQS